MEIYTPDWVKDAIFYQIFPERFAKSEHVPAPNNLQPWGATPTYNGFQGGNLLGIAEKLPYLADLGITAIYLNPVFASASNHRYHTHDYYQIDPILGTLADFQTLLKQAHGRGIRIILDGVFNHASRGFFQFNHLMECGPESPYVDWFHIEDWPLNAYVDHSPPNYKAWWGLHALPKFNTETTAVREFLWNVATYWLEQGIDGWRLDVPNEIDDDEFWREFRRRCRAVNPEAYIVGELWEESARWLQGDQFDGQMNYPLTRALFGFFLHPNINLKSMEGSGYGYIGPLDGHHFGAIIHSLYHDLYPREVVHAQMNLLGSHDTPRVATVAQGNYNNVRLLMMAMMTLPGAPTIYYGDEIGLRGAHDPYCRAAFPWADPTSWQTDLHQAIASYAHLRQQYVALRRGDLQILHTAESHILYARQHEENTAVIGFNLSEKEGNITCPTSITQVLLNRVDPSAPSIKPGQTITIPPHTGYIWTN